MSGWAPGVESVSASPDIDAVADPASRRMFMYLIEENRRIYGALHDSIGASNAATAGLASVTSALEATRLQLNTLVMHCSHIFSDGHGVFPSMINASSPLGTASSNTVDSALSTGSMTSIDCPEGPLKCPFCPRRHDTEKVHVQHWVRLLDRFVLFNYRIYLCVAIVYCLIVAQVGN